jgi:hypothetical protein
MEWGIHGKRKKLTSILIFFKSTSITIRLNVPSTHNIELFKEGK